MTVQISNLNLHQARPNQKDLKVYKLCEMLSLASYAQTPTWSGQRLFFICGEYHKNLLPPSERCLALLNGMQAYPGKVVRINRKFLGHINLLVGHKFSMDYNIVHGCGLTVTSYDLKFNNSKKPKAKSQLSSIASLVMKHDNLWQAYHPGVSISNNKVVLGCIFQSPTSKIFITSEELKQACLVQNSLVTHPGAKTMHFKNILAKKAQASRNILKRTILMQFENQKRTLGTLRTMPV